MDYKEKYEKALEKATAAYKDEDRHQKATLERIFPELKESEDERMIQYFKDLAPFDKAEELYEKYGFSHKDAIEWLEKKGDQKPETKVESIFNVGDWICHKVYKKPLRIVEDLGDGDFRTSPNSIVSAKEIEEGVFKHWYITDAKDGDVLVSAENSFPNIIIYGGYINNYGDIIGNKAILAYCGWNGEKLVINKKKKEGFGGIGYVPATKEQRDLLFQKMREAGYEWSAEKKELKKIEPKFKIGDTMRTLEEANSGITDGLPVVVSIDHDNYNCTNEIIAIKDQDKYEYPPRNRKHESSNWSEEDENLLKLSLENLTELKDRFGEEYGKVGDCIVWQKSIKDRLQSQQQQQWKPSKEHLDALINMKFAVEHFGPSASLAALDDLYNQLNKLTE